MSSLTFRNHKSELVDVPTVAGTRFKNHFGEVFEQAMLNGAVSITKHNAPKAMLLSITEFEALTRAHKPALDDPSAHFDDLLDSFQRPNSVRGCTSSPGLTAPAKAASAVQRYTGAPSQ